MHCGCKHVQRAAHLEGNLQDRKERCWPAKVGVDWKLTCERVGWLDLKRGESVLVINVICPKTALDYSPMTCVCPALGF